MGSFSDLTISLFKGGGQCFGWRAFSQNFTVYVLPIFIIIAVNIKCLIKDLLPLSMKVNVSHVCPLSFRVFFFFFFKAMVPRTEKHHVLASHNVCTLFVIVGHKFDYTKKSAACVRLAVVLSIVYSLLQLVDIELLAQ